MMELMTQTTPSANRWVSRASSLLKRGLWAATGGNRRKNRTLGHRDRRFSPRLKVQFEAKISDESGSLEARGVDIHRDGALVLARQPLAPKSVVFVQLKSFGLMGFAQVRHCTERGESNYAIGVEFPAPLMREEVGTWQFQRVCQTDNGWSEEWEASMNLSTALRAV
jgi:hypothetical protein